MHVHFKAPEILLKYILALVYSFVWQTVEAIHVLGRWCYATNASAPSLPTSSMSLIHPHTITITTTSILIVKHTQPHRLCSETRSSKTSEVGANPESRLTLSIHQLLFNSLSPSVLLKSAARGIVGIYCLLHTLAESLSQPSVPDAFSHVLPAFTTREMIPSYIPKEGQQAWTDEL